MVVVNGIRPSWIEPMLATLADKPFSDPAWVVEPKLDGERCLAYRTKGSVRLFSRHQQSLEIAYPELVEDLRAQTCQDFIVDGEVVAFRPGTTISSFSRLQKRMHAKSAEVALASGVPVSFYVFDILYLDGVDLRPLSLVDRKKRLKQALSFRGRLRYVRHLQDNDNHFYEEACRLGWEGLVAKRVASPYHSGRSSDWLKFKCLQEQEFVIGGYSEPEGSRSFFGALLVGYYDGGSLRYAGKVGTGYTQDVLRLVAEKMRPLEARQSPFSRDVIAPRGVHWVKPRLVAQLAFTEWTDEGKLRHPRFLGLRRDKRPLEVTRERKIRAKDVI